MTARKINANIKRIFLKSDDKNNDISKVKLASIKRGLKQIEKGQTISHNEVRKVYEKWLG